MKYYTRELWQLAQDIRAVSDYEKRWRLAHDEYTGQLAALRTRIGEDSYEFFAEADVHDGELLKVVIEDGSRPAPLSDSPRAWRETAEFPVKARLTVLDSEDRFIWNISYSSLRRIALDYPTSEPLFHHKGEGFGDWGYHELTDAGDGFLRHEILFASGTTILFEFMGIVVTRMLRDDGLAATDR